MPYDRTGLTPDRALAELRELRDMTGDSSGAQRVAWTPTWARARQWERNKLSDLPVTIDLDAAGNQWVTLKGKSERTLLIGGHIDSVPGGGWLDGALNLVAGYQVLRHIASHGEPPVTVSLVDWADEEARFGRSLFGSGAAAGTVTPDSVRALADKDNILLPDALSAYGVDLDRIAEARPRLAHAAAYIELHIEQGPVLESLNLPMGVVLGTCGVERSRLRFTGQSAHSGSTPMSMRRDALAPAAKLALEIRDIAERHGGVCTMGSVTTKPGIMTAVVGECVCTLDQRHLDPSALAAMLAEARSAAERFAAEEQVALEWELVFRIEPIPFHRKMIELGDQAVRETTGSSHRLPSGPLHDASEMSRAGIPTVMLFVQSLRGLSHTPEEDTREDHLLLSVQALDRLAFAAMDWIAAQP